MLRGCIVCLCVPERAESLCTSPPGESIRRDPHSSYIRVRFLWRNHSFSRTFRLEYAYQLLEQKAGSASDIASRTGFRSLAYFSYAFKQHYGKNPSSVGSLQ